MITSLSLNSMFTMNPLKDIIMTKELTWFLKGLHSKQKVLNDYIVIIKLYLYNEPIEKYYDELNPRMIKDYSNCTRIWFHQDTIIS